MVNRGEEEEDEEEEDEESNCGTFITPVDYLDVEQVFPDGGVGTGSVASSGRAMPVHQEAVANPDDPSVVSDATFGLAGGPTIMHPTLVEGVVSTQAEAVSPRPGATATPSTRSSSVPPAGTAGQKRGHTEVIGVDVLGPSTKVLQIR